MADPDFDSLLDRMVAGAERRGLQAIAAEESAGGTTHSWPPPHNESAEIHEELTEEDCAYIISNHHRIFKRIAKAAEEEVDEASYAFEKGWSLRRREDSGDLTAYVCVAIAVVLLYVSIQRYETTPIEVVSQISPAG